MADEKVTKFPRKPKAHAPVLEVVQNYVGCRHLRATIDEKLAELTCSDCGSKLNPYQFLMTMANELTSWEHEAQKIKQLRAELAERQRCRCTKCGEMTEIRTVHKDELARIKGAC